MRPWLPFEAIAALRFLAEGRMQSGFIVGGVAIGVGVIIFMSAMLAGLQANFIKRVLTSQPHVQLLAPDQVARPLRVGSGVIEDATVQRPAQRNLSIDQWKSVTAALETRPEVRVVSPTVAGSALAVRGQASRSVSVTGIDPDRYFRVVRLPDYMVAGDVRLGADDILIGIELSRDLGIGIGDKVALVAALGRERILRVIGVFDLGNKGVNARNVYVGLRTAQSMFDLVGGATTIDVTLDDIYSADRVADEVASMAAVRADSWMRTNAQFYTAVRAQGTSNTLIRLFVGLSVAFGIAAVLVVSVIQRSKEIGILRAMGARRGQIMRVFLIQGAVLGFTGSLIGSALGAASLVSWHALARQADGSELFPLVLEPSLFLAAAGLATLVGLIAAVAPAVRAAQLDPVEAIRG
ncbi:ABC transporter permease [Alsobacter sp. R-9]